MIQTCNADHWRGMEDMMPTGPTSAEKAPCGKTYDDAEQSTICPHRELPPAGPTIRAS